jgi:hypothetical protein
MQAEFCGGKKFKGTGTPAKKGFKVICRKADGSTEFSDVGADGDRTIITKDQEGSFGAVISKAGKTRRKVAYNFGDKYGGTLSKQKREADINNGLNRLRAEYRSTGGMNKSGTMKHVASIPEELWYSHKAENGADVFSDPKEVKRFASEWGFNVAGRRR